MRTTFLFFFSLIGCEFVELHPWPCDCGLFPEAGVSDADVGDAGRPGDANVDEASDGGRDVLSRASAQPLPGVPFIIGETWYRPIPRVRPKSPFLQVHRSGHDLPGALPHRL